MNAFFIRDVVTGKRVASLIHYSGDERIDVENGLVSVGEGATRLEWRSVLYVLEHCNEVEARIWKGEP